MLPHDQTEAMTMGTRIVVMKDGFIQQIDNPTNLYLHPKNTFVAGFIGMPPMNFINATILVKGDAVTLNFNDIAIALPQKYWTADVKAYDGKEVIMGVRPEALSDETRFVAEHPETTFPASVDVVEMLGAETYLYVTVAGVLNMTARVDPTVSHSKVGEISSLAVDGNRVHLFDKDTELVILS